MAVSQSATITAQFQFTTPLFIIGWFNISAALPSGAAGSLGGTTVTVQRSFDGGTLYRDVKQYTATSEEYGFEPEGALYRVGVKIAQYVVSVNVRVGCEPGMTH